MLDLLLKFYNPLLEYPPATILPATASEAKKVDTTTETFDQFPHFLLGMYGIQKFCMKEVQLVNRQIG